MGDARPVKYILVTGGVVSSLGKGLAAASIGALLEGHGYKVALQKFDPYINVDPGTMSPYQHGEVYVTDDGAETDLDLGHYERFTNQVDHAQQQLDDRQDLSVRDPARAAGRLSGPDGPGDSAHHQRDQGQHPRGREGRGHRARRDRRHGRRHREPAVSRGHPAAPAGCGPREHALHPPDARAVHRRGGRAEDQADAAQRARPPCDRHPARHPALPHRSVSRSGHQAEDRAVLRRRRRGGHHREGRRQHLRSAARARGGGARSHPARAPEASQRPWRRWAHGWTSSIASGIQPTTSPSTSSASTSATRIRTRA